MKVTLPLALAPVTQEDDMRWNPKFLPRPLPLLLLPLPSGQSV